VLYDQNRKPVYYEIAMNRDQYDYIHQNGLYNADTQLAYASKQTITLPMGEPQNMKPGAIELKVAWKILGPGDVQSRFHTAQAIVVGTGGQPQQVTVGLVGLHIVQMVAGLPQAAWGTFAHVDNAPSANKSSQGPYSFYNLTCPIISGCTPNSPLTNPTQVVQMNPDGVRDYDLLVPASVETLVIERHADARVAYEREAEAWREAFIRDHGVIPPPSHP
jgi:hypothetical protein